MNEPATYLSAIRNITLQITVIKIIFYIESTHWNVQYNNLGIKK
jgi:hypothetical protein